MSVATYAMDERLRMSNGVSVGSDVEKILLRNIPGARHAYKACADNDKSGVDWWLERSNGTHLAVDCKVREEDWARKHPTEDDLALEVWSVKEKKKIGWTLDESKRTDIVLWLWKDTGRWCLIPFVQLCKTFQVHVRQWVSQYRRAVQQTPSYGGYHSECVFVPRTVIFQAIQQQFGGEL